MEESSYSELKSSLSSISAKALSFSSRQKLANNLDFPQPLQSEEGFSRDYRGLAELMGFLYNAIKIFEASRERTMKILESGETRSNATLDKLISYLEDIDRHDIIEELIPSLKKNVADYLEYQKSLESPIQVPEVTPGPMNLQHSQKGVLTRDDLRNGEHTTYDAYVSYADEDSNIAAEFARVLESPTVGLKLFIRGRDMLAGCSELDTDIELIKNRCRRMLILLTPNFLRSPQSEFQVSFASSLAIAQKQRILVPVILAPCQIPPILEGESTIDFTNECTKTWVMDRLIASLLPEGNIALSEKHNLCLANGFDTSLNITPVGVPHDDNTPTSGSPEIKISVVCSEEKESVPTSKTSPSSKKFFQFLPFIKRKGQSSSASSTSFSSGTSGFHSQSLCDVRSLENSNHSNNDT